MTIVFTSGNSRSNNDRVLSVDINHSQNCPEEVKLTGRELVALPNYVRKNIHLKILDLSHNFLGRGDAGTIAQLAELHHMTRLNLSVNELKTVPLDFSLFPLLEVLCLAGNELEYLTEDIVNLQRLKRLHCDFNCLNRLPHDWSALTSLTALTLSNNSLVELPATIWTLQSLEILNLQKNRISNIGPLPEGAARRLKELKLSWNRLSGSLDLSILESLAHLDVSHNDLEAIDVSNLQELETVVANHNALKAMNLNGTKLRLLRINGNELEEIACKVPPLLLESLDISQNNFKFLPDWISEAKCLRNLFAEQNRLSNIPGELFTFPNLSNVKLNHNYMTNLPDLSVQCHIKLLCLQYNKFSKLPDNFFWAFPCLVTLNLSYNCLNSIPQTYGPMPSLKCVLLSGNSLEELGNLTNLLRNSRIESLHLAYNKLKIFPDDFFGNLSALRTLSLSGNEIDIVPSRITKIQNLEKLYLHSNQLSSIQRLSDFNNLQVLDLACNQVQNLELASIVPKDLTYLDLSANCNLQIDPSDFQHLCCQRSVAVVDVNCAGRQAPIKDSVSKETELCSPWTLGFTESHDGNTRIYIEFQKDSSNGHQEALIALMEVDDLVEVGQLRSVLPELLKAERESKETYHQFLKNSLLSCIRYLRSKGYEKDFGITMCHLSSSSGSPVTLRLGTVGRPSSCILGRSGNIIVLAQRQDAAPFEVEEWISAIQGTEICYNNHLSNLHSKPMPREIWTSVPDPEVRELVLSSQDKFLVFGDSTFAQTLPAEEVCRQVQSTSSPVAASKALSEIYSALTNGRRECISVIMLKSDASFPVEEEVEKYRCWEFMLEQNHKLLFTKELETLHKTGLQTDDQTPSTVDPSSWYTSALSKYKCPLPSHRGRYYCYGNKLE